jgi:hypothetical protein
MKSLVCKQATTRFWSSIHMYIIYIIYSKACSNKGDGRVQNIVKFSVEKVTLIIIIIDVLKHLVMEINNNLSLVNYNNIIV